MNTAFYSKPRFRVVPDPKPVQAPAPVTEKIGAARPVSDVVLLRQREDGTWYEKPAAPSFLRKRGIGRGNVELPADYFFRDSDAHLARGGLKSD